MLSFLMLSLIPLTITGYLSYIKSSNAIKGKISTYSVEVMNQIGQNIQMQTNRIKAYSEEILSLDVVQNGLGTFHNLEYSDKVTVKSTLLDLLKQKFVPDDTLVDIEIITTDGERIRYNYNRADEVIKDEEINNLVLKAAKSKGAPVWSLVTTTISGANAVVLCRTINSLYSGESIGTVLIAVKEKYISEIYSKSYLGTNTDIFIIDTDGKVISSRSPKVEIGKEYGEKELAESLNNMPKTSGNTFQFDTEDGKYLVSYVYLPTSRWYTVCTIPFTYLNAESDNLRKNTLLIIGICFIFSLILSFIISKSISVPLKKLVIAMEKAKSGDFKVQVNDSSKDELGIVTSNFNSMVEEIKGLISDIKIKENQKRLVELKVLQAQINPHFLSNTLNTVSWLAEVQKADNISDLVKSLIQLLHVSMGKGRDLISIREEIEYLKNYINIQKYKYFDKFEVDFDVEDEILDNKILKFLLQPIVENSIIHGIEPLEGQGMIAVKMFKDSGNIKITVTDNGVGISEGKLKEIFDDEQNNSKKRFSSIGIKNVEERIKLYFGEQYKMNITSVPNLFTIVEIIVPAIGKEE